MQNMFARAEEADTAGGSLSEYSMCSFTSKQQWSWWWNDRVKSCQCTRNIFSPQYLTAVVVVVVAGIFLSFCMNNQVSEMIKKKKKSPGKIFSLESFKTSQWQKVLQMLTNNCFCVWHMAWPNFQYHLGCYFFFFFFFLQSTNILEIMVWKIKHQGLKVTNWPITVNPLCICEISPNLILFRQFCLWYYVTNGYRWLIGYVSTQSQSYLEL